MSNDSSFESLFNEYWSNISGALSNTLVDI